MKFLITEPQIVQAMHFFQQKAGPRDGISICTEVSSLADLLGVMWHEKEVSAEISGESKVFKLVSESGCQLVALQGDTGVPNAQDGGRTDSLSKTASWVIKNKLTGEVIMETFDKAKVDALNTAKYVAVPILEYLQSLSAPAALIYEALTSIDVEEPPSTAAGENAEYDDQPQLGKGSVICSTPAAVPGTMDRMVSMKARIHVASMQLRICSMPLLLHPLPANEDDHLVGMDFNPFNQPDPVTGEKYTSFCYVDDAGYSFDVDPLTLIASTQLDLTPSEDEEEGEQMACAPGG